MCIRDKKAYKYKNNVLFLFLRFSKMKSYLFSDLFSVSSPVKINLLCSSKGNQNETH